MPINKKGETPEGQAFLKKLPELLPDSMSGKELINVLGTIVTNFTPNRAECREAVTALAVALDGYYASLEEVCTCEDCKEKRQKDLH